MFQRFRRKRRRYKEVLQVHRRNTCEFVYLNVGGEEIKTTPKHLFFKADGQWETASNLKVGDELVSETGENKIVLRYKVKLPREI
ncbi:polymorphic toxin-type HINT domain-containing protein [Clostridium guangxiense]|uniref:polymorphic toxin-type HINT domain-containing protein n=1 Tax=Clostridium guangxiense TaxID=1662055 RepID=UPI0038B2507A